MKTELKVAMVILGIIVCVLASIPVFIRVNKSYDIDTDRINKIYQSICEISEKRDEVLLELIQRPGLNQELLEKMRTLETKYITLLMSIDDIKVREYRYKYPGIGYASIEEILKETPEPLVELEYGDTYKDDIYDYEEGRLIVSSEKKCIWSTNVIYENNSFEQKNVKDDAVMVFSDSHGYTMVVIRANK